MEEGNIPLTNTVINTDTISIWQENESPNDCSTQFSNRQQLEHMLLREKKTNVENVKGKLHYLIRIYDYY